MTTPKLVVSFQKNVLDLNDDAIMAILSYLSYDEVAKLRLVCQKFNDICMKQLNRGLAGVLRYNTKCLVEVKAKLPRRISQRAIHPLSECFDILHSIECHLQVLSYKYCVKNYSEQTEYCHFIPGKILDESCRIMRELMNSSNNEQLEMSEFKVLQEFRDLSEMAEEHFNEHILPGLKRKQNLDPCGSSFLGGDCSSSSLAMDIASFYSAAFVRVLSAIGNAVYSSLSSMVSSLSSGLKSYSSASQQSGLSLTIVGHQQEEINELKAKTTELEQKILEQDKLLAQLIEDLRELKQTAPDAPLNPSATELQMKQSSLNF